jgi:sugar lactone lactonase YvrE
MSTLSVELVLDAGATLGEGPVWDARSARLVWVDILGAAIHRFDPASGEDEQIPTVEPVGVAIPRRGGGLVAALEHRLALVDPDTGSIDPIATIRQPGPPWRFNDGACDAAGRLWAGTMAYDFTPGAGRLYRLDPDLTVSCQLGEVTISNGIAWAQDGGTMYYVDTPAAGIDAFAFDLESGALGRRRRLVDLPPGAGTPDGLTIDAEGALWVALFDGGAVRRYTPDGRLDAEVSLPVCKVTSLAFGGPRLDILYITSARLGLDDRELAQQPHAGAVFAIEPGVAGVPAHEFAG